MTLPPFRLQRGQRARAGDLLGRIGEETLHFPLPVPSRLAVIDAAFHIGVNMKFFRSNENCALCEYAPEAMALPLNSALFLADRKAHGLIDLPGLNLALVVLTSVDDAAMAAHHRDLLWKAFGLPVFEQLRGRDGRVFARECEVHDGLHFDTDSAAAIPNGCAVEIIRQYCECGIESPRLRHLAVTKSRAAAA